MKVFISFSSADKKIAEKIYERLKKNGIDCWICTRDIPPGADYQACIVDAINHADVVVLVFSSKANSSPEIAKELSLASKKILIPARIEDVVPQGSFQYQLSNRQFVDLFEDFDNKLDELVQRIKAVVEGTTFIPGPGPRHSRKLGMRLAIGAAAILAAVAGGWYVNSRAAFPAHAEMALAPASAPATLHAASAAPPSAPISSTAALPASSAPAPSAAVQDEPASQPTSAVKLAQSDTKAVSPRAAASIAMLGTTKNYDRLNAIKTMLDQLPSPLNALEADAVLKDLSNHRAAGITLITQKLAPDLGGQDSTLILGDTSNYDRLTGIKSLVQGGRLRQNLSPAEAKIILDGTGNHRQPALTLIASLIDAGLTGKDAAVILGDLQNYDRMNGIKSLADAGKFKNGLTSDEANIVLDGTGNHRQSAIGILANKIAPSLDGKAMATVLGDSKNYDRLTGLTSLARAGRISDRLQPNDLQPILEQMEPQRTDGLRVLAPYIAK